MPAELPPLISADSHVEEPPGLWYDELPKAMREDLPPEMRPTDSETQYSLRVGAKKDSELTAAEIEGERHRQAVASLGTTSLDARFKIMREEGVVGECIYPTKGLYLWNMDNPKTGVQCARLWATCVFSGFSRTTTSANRASGLGAGRFSASPSCGCSR